MRFFQRASFAGLEGFQVVKNKNGMAFLFDLAEEETELFKSMVVVFILCFQYDIVPIAFFQEVFQGRQDRIQFGIGFIKNKRTDPRVFGDQALQEVFGHRRFSYPALAFEQNGIVLGQAGENALAVAAAADKAVAFPLLGLQSFFAADELPGRVTQFFIRFFPIHGHADLL